jgi:hypothetical protein
VLHPSAVWAEGQGEHQDLQDYKVLYPRSHLQEISLLWAYDRRVQNHQPSATIANSKLVYIILNLNSIYPYISSQETYVLKLSMHFLVSSLYSARPVHLEIPT